MVDAEAFVPVEGIIKGDRSKHACIDSSEISCPEMMEYDLSQIKVLKALFFFVQCNLWKFEEGKIKKAT